MIIGERYKINGKVLRVVRILEGRNYTDGSVQTRPSLEDEAGRSYYIDGDTLHTKRSPGARIRKIEKL